MQCHRPAEILPLSNLDVPPAVGEESPRRYVGASQWMRAAYFFQYAGIGAYSPYLTLYYRNLGLSGPDIGILAAIQPLATAVLAPLWGLVADRWGVHRMVLRIGVIGSAAVALLLLGASSFWQFLPLIAMLAFFVSPSSSLLDSYGVTISERRGIGFGAIRIWGSIGYIVATWLGGWFMGGIDQSLVSVGVCRYAADDRGIHVRLTEAQATVASACLGWGSRGYAPATDDCAAADLLFDFV